MALARKNRSTFRNYIAHLIEPDGGTFNVSGQYECYECYKYALSVSIVHYFPDVQKHFKTIHDIGKLDIPSSGEGGGHQDSVRYDLGDIVLNP